MNAIRRSSCWRSHATPCDCRSGFPALNLIRFQVGHQLLVQRGQLCAVVERSAQIGRIVTAATQRHRIGKECIKITDIDHVLKAHVSQKIEERAGLGYRDDQTPDFAYQFGRDFLATKLRQYR